MANYTGLFSSNSDNWSTPQDLYNELNKEFNFTLDPCADVNNHKCAKYFTKEVDGLKQSWGGERTFVNPPYGRELPKWVRKAYMEHLKPNTVVVMLIPARTDTSYFHRYIYNHAEIRFIKGCLKFGGSKNGAPFPSMLVIYRSAD